MNNLALNAQVKRKLNITWEDDDTTARIAEIIASAIPFLKHKLGITDADFDFGAPGAENTLFLAYCLYEWNHAVNDFEENYHQMIADVTAQWEVKNYLANSEGSGNAET